LKKHQFTQMAKQNGKSTKFSIYSCIGFGRPYPMPYE